MIVALASALPVAIFSSSLLAQENGSAVSPVLQVQRPKGADQLGNYLTRLAANPRDVDALIGAGESALQLEDPRSAAGFFARADAISPNQGRVKAGLARSMLKMEKPSEAVRYFDRSEERRVGKEGVRTGRSRWLQ